MNKREYDNPEYKKFRSEVRKRDSYRCQFTGCKATKKLQVHHIIKWASHPSLRFSPANGITLCKVHHKLITGKEHIYAPMFQRIAKENQDKNGL
jgi:5-methylcytosine-specific restriction endonuclease McrA